MKHELLFDADVEVPAGTAERLEAVITAALEAEEGWTPYQSTLSRALFRGPRTPQASPAEKEPRKSRQRPADDNLLSLL